MSVTRVLIEHTSADIAEWMAFDNLKDEKYMQNIKDEMLDDDERMEKLKKLLGYKE